MYNYKSRWEAIKMGFTVGMDEADKLGLDKDYHNWSPLMLHCYQTGVFGGLIVAIVMFIWGIFIGLAH